MRLIPTLLVSLCLGALSIHAAVTPSAGLKARQALAGLPMRFEPNTGAWDRQVRFAARSAGYGVALTGREAIVSVGSRRIAMSLAGGNRAPEMLPLEPLAARGSYFLGSRREAWRTNVPQYGGVRSRAVYPGIDVVYYGNGGHLEYDFVLQPGADPSRIRMHFRGADRLSLTPDGDLALDAAGGRLLQKRPVVYQQDGSGNRREIAARYRLLDGHTAGVQLASYDRSRTVTIDPVLQYASLFGGANADAVTAVRIDREGFIWAAGYVTDGSITATSGAFNGAFSSGTDIFVAKIDPNASGPDSLVYFTYIGGSGSDVPTDMALDNKGNIYLTGSTSSPDFPLGGWAYQPTQKNGSTDAFALKLHPDATGKDALLWSTYLGGGKSDEGKAIAVDGAGNVYITGVTQSTDFPVTSSAYQSTLWGTQDAFVAKLNPNTDDAAGSLAYSTYIGGEGYDDGRAIAVTPDGIAYAAGATGSAQFPWSGAPYQGNSAGGTDIWLARFDCTKAGGDSVPMATYFGGSGSEEPRRMVLDSEGKLWLTGYTLSSDFPITESAYQTAPSGDTGDAFVARIDMSPAHGPFLLYSTYLGGKGGNVGYGIAPDNTGKVWVTGYTLSPGFPVTGDAVQGAWGGGVDVFATKLDTTVSGSGALVYSTYLGQINVQVGNSIALGPNGSVAVGGSTPRTGIQATDRGARKDYAGGPSDGFVVVLAQ